MRLVKEPLPEADTKQMFPMAKQPPVRLMPLANVEEAVIEVTESVPVWIPPAKVEVEMFVATKALAVVVPKSALMFEAKIPPPVIVRPLEEDSPAVETPPAKVEDEVLVTTILLAVVVANCVNPETDKEVEVAFVKIADVA